jgi:uncharacterized protein with PIN domain
MTLARFQFHAEFDPFLAKEHQQNPFEYRFKAGQSVKHLIEATGVPHTEVHHILVNGKPVDFSYQVQQADFVQIYPYRDPGGFPPLVLALEMGQVGSNPGFVLDNHLGKLASYLRLLGFDCLYRNDYQDQQLAHVSRDEKRILLTRDQRLLMRNAVQRGYWVHSKTPRQQVREIMERFDLYESIHPFQRCVKCNAILQPVAKEKVLDRLESLTRRYFDVFRICPGCQQIYWQGSHYTRIMAFIDEIRNHSNPAGRSS